MKDMKIPIAIESTLPEDKGSANSVIALSSAAQGKLSASPTS